MSDIERRLRKIEASLEWMSSSDNILVEALDELEDRIEQLESTITTAGWMKYVEDRVDRLEVTGADPQPERGEMDRQNKTRVHGPVDRAEFERLERAVRELDRRIYFGMMHGKAATNPEPDSDGWIPWHGGECPVGANVAVEFRLRSDQPSGLQKAGQLRWQHIDGETDITHYRPAKQEAEWPQEGDEYWWIASWMFVQSGKWHSDYITDGVRDFLGIYPTREQAEERAKQIQKAVQNLNEGGKVYIEAKESCRIKEILHP